MLLAQIDWNLVIGSGGLLAVVGGSTKFLWNKVEEAAKKREDATNLRFQQIELKLKHCELREDISYERRQVHVTVIEILWQELTRFTGKKSNPALVRAKHLLDGLKAFPPPNVELTRLAQELDANLRQRN